MITAKVILVCGKICSGKSTYAQKLRKTEKAVILSVDEITLALFEPFLGERHEEITAKAQKYLFEKSLEIIETGISVILDWGFWTAESRRFAAEYYKARSVEYEFHYIDVSGKMWKNNIDKRNGDVLCGKTIAYYIDGGLEKKCQALFEPPDKKETDVWIEIG